MNRFGTYFNGIESFYQKNFLVETRGDFPQEFSLRQFESDSDKYWYADFAGEDHPIRFPPMFV
jgi:hypothetical protein